MDRGRKTEVHVDARGGSGAGAWIAGALVLLLIVGLVVWFLPAADNASPGVAIERVVPDVGGGAAAGATSGGGAAGAVAGSADR